jgi:ribosomal protein S18 acetylase RimI-like enzyme
VTSEAGGETITYRMASIDDVPALAALRWEMEAERRDAALAPEAYIAAYDTAIRGEIEHGTYRAWLAESGGEAVACVVLVSWMMPPHFDALYRRRGSVSSVYCRPAFRRQGITRRLMELLIAHAREQEVGRLVLWASDMGRPLYESLGFLPSRSMELNL